MWPLGETKRSLMMLLILRYLNLVTDDNFPHKRLDFSTGIHFSSIPPISASQLITENTKSHTCLVSQLPDWTATVC